MNNLDFEGTQYDSLNSENHTGWRSLGTSTDPFTGTFDGQEFLIKNLFSLGARGLFGYISEGTVKNLGIVSRKVTGGTNVGALAGHLSSQAAISGCFSAGYVSGNENTGGLVGTSSGESLIINSYSKGVV